MLLATRISGTEYEYLPLQTIDTLKLNLIETEPEVLQTPCIDYS